MNAFLHALSYVGIGMAATFFLAGLVWFIHSFRGLAKAKLNLKMAKRDSQILNVTLDELKRLEAAITPSPF